MTGAGANGTGANEIPLKFLENTWDDWAVTAAGAIKGAARCPGVAVA